MGRRWGRCGVIITWVRLIVLAAIFTLDNGVGVSILIPVSTVSALCILIIASSSSNTVVLIVLVIDDDSCGLGCVLALFGPWTYEGASACASPHSGM